uniref:Uncharacterized protein n=1 Tax=Trichuris muris TaxID=70415 RepID=A0A5S6Q7I2_TRIMR
MAYNDRESVQLLCDLKPAIIEFREDMNKYYVREPFKLNYVREATQEEVNAHILNDLQRLPHFKHDPSGDLITEVQLPQLDYIGGGFYDTTAMTNHSMSLIDAHEQNICKSIDAMRGHIAKWVSLLEKLKLQKQ